MAVPFSNTKLRVPRGFQNILLVLSREIIRDNPIDIITYSADFFEKLLRIRQDTGHDPAAHGAHAEDRFYNNYAFKASLAKAAEEEERQAEVKVSRQESAEKSAEQKKESSLDEQTGEVAQEQKDAPSGEENVEVEVSSQEQTEVLDTDMNDPTMDEAATKIQAQFRGYQTRKHLQ